MLALTACNDPMPSGTATISVSGDGEVKTAEDVAIDVITVTPEDDEAEITDADEEDEAGETAEAEETTTEEISSEEAKTTEEGVVEYQPQIDPIPVIVDETAYTGYATAPLNVRSGDSTDYSVIGGLAYAQAVKVTGTCENGWLRVDYNGAEGFCSGKYISKTEPAPVTSEAAVSGICESRGGASAKWVNMVNAQLATVPSNIVNAAIARGWHIYATTENLDQTYFGGAYGSVMGVTNYDNKVVAIECRENAVRESVAHEMGHVLDNMCGSPSASSEFASIYNEEVDTFRGQISNPGCVRDTTEFFAETFYYICKNPSKCTPRAMEFVQRYMGTV